MTIRLMRAFCACRPGRQAPAGTRPCQVPDNQLMPLPPPPVRRHSDKANNELLFKGIACALIGLAVLLSPYFIRSPGMQGIVANSSLVGWFPAAVGHQHRCRPI